MLTFNNKLWDSKVYDELNKYLKENKRSQIDIEFEQKIVNTKLTCYAIKSEVINQICKEILMGNYLSFLNNCDITNYPISIIFVKVLSQVTTYSDFEKYFIKYSSVIDSWAHCDIFKLKIKKLGLNNIKIFIDKNIYSKNLFVRRICVIILLKNFINIDIEYAFKTINKLINEKEYYVNMAISWFLCDCWIKQRDKTYNYINTQSINPFVLNKFISKCCDSYRVTDKDKLYLKSLRKKGD